MFGECSAVEFDGGHEWSSEGEFEPVSLGSCGNSFSVTRESREEAWRTDWQAFSWFSRGQVIAPMRAASECSIQTALLAKGMPSRHKISNLAFTQAF